MDGKGYKKQLVDYLIKNLRKGYTKESLKWALVDQGHSKMEINHAFQRVEQELASKAPILKTRPEIKYELIEPVPENPENIVKNTRISFWKKMFG